MSQLSSIMDILLANVVAEVGEDGICSKSLQPGDSVLAEYVGLEGCNGMIWVRLQSAGPTVTFPNIGVTPGNCAYTLAVPLEVGVLRPPPPATQPLGRNVALPEDSSHTSATHQQIEDMMAMRRAIIKSFRNADELHVLGAYQPMGPQEGVLGGMWTVTVEVD